MSALRGRAFVRAIVHAAVLACALAACAAVDAGAAVVPGEFYGVNSGSTLVDDDAARPAALREMHDGGLSFVRVDAAWGGVEPAAPVGGEHAYAWEKYDRFVADLARNGLRWYPMIGYSAPWASSTPGDPFAPPAGDADFASFAAALAARYGTNGAFWAQHPDLPARPTTVYGIWNEPSNPQFWHGPEATPARYMQLYLAARAAIAAVDPRARTATAGLLDSGSVDGAAYLRAMLASTPHPRGEIDAVGWHPYVGDLGQTLASVGRARTTLDRYGLATVPIEISEVGWGRDGGFAPAKRAEVLRGLAAQLPHAGMGVTRLMPYVWTGSPEWQITNPDGSLGQLGGAYFAGIRDARATRPAPAAKAARSACRTRRAGRGCWRKLPRRALRVSASPARTAIGTAAAAALGIGRLGR
ncbi:MAG: polysaccharide biosynthesis protein PslG [Solirubrobacteraceae bacterium]|nr:polysaccharide biosynthesis protein PslG [Solirubrobacteraceae bacterium]